MIGAAAAAVAAVVLLAQPSTSALLERALARPATVEPDDRAGEADGVLPPGGVSVDDGRAGVAHIDADLLSALRAAAADAAERGVRILITSGWRSPEYQDRLLREAVSQYGSEDEAARWVATSATSLHVSGDAVDVGSYDAMDWLAEHGAEYGLCGVYDNEPWHFELRPDAVAVGCPPTYRDPTLDPRLQG